MTDAFLKDKGYLSAVILIVLGMTAASTIWPFLIPQLVVTSLGVALGVVVADYVLVKREAKLALKSILSAPEAKGFLEGWDNFKRLVGDLSQWWETNKGVVKEDAATLLSMIHELAERRKAQKEKVISPPEKSI